MMSESTGNVVTLRIPAGLYVLLVQEIEFAASIESRDGMTHNKANAVMLYKLLLEQGGVTVKEAQTPSLPEQPRLMAQLKQTLGVK